VRTYIRTGTFSYTFFPRCFFFFRKNGGVRKINSSKLNGIQRKKSYVAFVSGNLLQYYNDARIIHTGRFPVSDAYDRINRNYIGALFLSSFGEFAKRVPFSVFARNLSSALSDSLSKKCSGARAKANERDSDASN